MRAVDPHRVELVLRDEGDGEPALELVERYPPGHGVERVRELYANLLGPESSVDVEEKDGEAVVRASVEGDGRGVALTVAAATATNLVQRAGGLDHLRRQLVQAETGDRGIQ